MRFREWNEPVQTLATDGPDYPLADPIGHRTARRSLDDAQPEAANGAVQFRGEDTVAVVDQKLVSGLVPQSLTQVLACPQRARMRRHVAVNQPSAVMLHHHEHIQ